MTLAEMLNGSPLQQQRMADEYSMARDLLRSRHGTIQDPAKASQYRPDVLPHLIRDESPAPIDMKWGTDVVMNMMPQAGIFAGINAKTANKLMLQRAQEMTSKGADRKEIWNKTGWYKDIDGKWKFEIDDSKSTVELMTKGKKGETVLSESLNHPEAYQAYPSMKDTRISLGRGGGRGGGVFYPESLNPGTPDRMVISGYKNPAQLPEDVERGLAMSQIETIKKKIAKLDNSDVRLDTKKGRAYHTAFDKLRDEAQAIADKFNKGGNFKEYAPDRSIVLHEGQHNIQDIEGFAQGGKGKRAQKLAGEAAARNVETRRDFTAKQRRERPPWSTLDVPEEDLLVRMLTGR